MDDADLSQAKTEVLEAADIAEVRRRAAAIPKGEPGDCDLCGEWFGRLVKGVCARCRDLHKLP
jgi:hypothetical protein